MKCTNYGFGKIEIQGVMCESGVDGKVGVRSSVMNTFLTFETF